MIDPGTSQANVLAGPRSVLWMPVVDVPPPSVTSPYTNFTRPVASSRTSSKFAVPVAGWKAARHSTTNCRFGGLPITAVKIPVPAWSVTRSSQSNEIDLPRPRPGSGQTLLHS